MHDPRRAWIRAELVSLAAVIVRVEHDITGNGRQLPAAARRAPTGGRRRSLWPAPSRRDWAAPGASGDLKPLLEQRHRVGGQLVGSGSWLGTSALEDGRPGLCPSSKTRRGSSRYFRRHHGLDPDSFGKRPASHSLSGTMKSLEDLRAQLDVLDRRLLEIVAERQALGAEIAVVKRATGQFTRDFGRERDVLLRARADANELGVPPALAEALLKSLIRGSLTTQEQARVAAQGAGTGRSALVIGGRGKMGRWMADFLASQGFRADDRGSGGCRSRLRVAPRLERLRARRGPDRRRDAPPDRERGAGCARGTPPARARLRRRLAQDAAP